MRVRRNVGFEVNEVVKTLKQLDSTGFYPQILYHRTEQIRLNLYVVIDEGFSESMCLISNHLSGLEIYSCYKRRMQIDHGFRDIKSGFGFGSLVLKRPTKSRINLLWLLGCLTYGLLFITYEKSGYQWVKSFNPTTKTYSLITVIKRVVSQAWLGWCLSPFFTLPLCRGDTLQGA